MPNTVLEFKWLVNINLESEMVMREAEGFVSGGELVFVMGFVLEDGTAMLLKKDKELVSLLFRDVDFVFHISFNTPPDFSLNA